jgi:hypothetical protein
MAETKANKPKAKSKEKLEEELNIDILEAEPGNGRRSENDGSFEVLEIDRRRVFGAFARTLRYI